MSTNRSTCRRAAHYAREGGADDTYKGVNWGEDPKLQTYPIVFALEDGVDGVREVHPIGRGFPE